MNEWNFSQFFFQGFRDMLILFIYSFPNKSQSYSFLFLDFMLFYLSFSYNLLSSFRLLIYYPLPLTAFYYTPTPAPLY